MTTVSIRLDDSDKRELDAICADMGMNISTFYMIYTKKVLRDRRIPFDITAPRDPFYDKQNQQQLLRADQQIRSGHVAEHTMEELEHNY